MNPFMLYNFSIIPIVIPLMVLVYHLITHLKDRNGDVGKLRHILIWVFCAKIFGWMVQFFVSLCIIGGANLNQVMIYASASNFVLGATNLWALMKIKRL